MCRENFDSSHSLPHIVQSFHLCVQHTDISRVCRNLFKGLPVKTGVFPLEREISELVELLPDFLNLLSIAKDLNLIVVNIQNHFLMVLVIICAQFIMTSFKSSNTVLMVIHTLGQVFKNFFFVTFEVLKLLWNFA